MENYFFQSKLHEIFWLSAPSGGSLYVLLHTASFILDPAFDFFAFAYDTFEGNYKGNYAQHSFVCRLKLNFDYMPQQQFLLNGASATEIRFTDSL